MNTQREFHSAIRGGVAAIYRRLAAKNSGGKLGKHPYTQLRLHLQPLPQNSSEFPTALELIGILDIANRFDWLSDRASNHHGQQINHPHNYDVSEQKLTYLRVTE